jgi:hypothetical protein
MSPRASPWQRARASADEVLATLNLAGEQLALTWQAPEQQVPSPVTNPAGPSTGLAWSVEPGPERYMEMSEDMRHIERNRWWHTPPSGASLPSNASAGDIQEAGLRRRPTSLSRLDTPPARTTAEAVAKAAPASLGPPPPLPRPARVPQPAPIPNLVPDPEQLVMITPFGKKFHSDECIHIRNGEFVTLRVAYARRFRPCWNCGAERFIHQQLVRTT